MTIRILIGYDGSECADAALDDLNSAGLPHDVEAHIISVAESWLPPPPPSVEEIIDEATNIGSPAELHQSLARESTEWKDAFALAERAADRLKGKFPQWIVTTDAACGSVGWELIAKADEWKPDLILVGSHGRTALGKFVLGSVSQRVLTEAKCSVRVARGRVDEPNTSLRIMVGVDGSQASHEALSTVASRSWPPGSEVKVMFVNSPLLPEMWGKVIPQFRNINEEGLKDDQSWVERISKLPGQKLRSAGVKVTAVVRKGDPKKELPKAAEEWGADCIYLGSTGFSNRFERFVLGSVSASVAARAHCSVEVVRPKEAPRD